MTFDLNILQKVVRKLKRFTRAISHDLSLHRKVRQMDSEEKDKLLIKDPEKYAIDFGILNRSRLSAGDSRCIYEPMHPLNHMNIELSTNSCYNDNDHR
jgi:hypothetical protein